jgi:hypothetical protein
MLARCKRSVDGFTIRRPPTQQSFGEATSGGSSSHTQCGRRRSGRPSSRCPCSPTRRVGGALVATGGFLVLLTVLAWPRLLAIDATAVGLDLLKGVPMFAPLSVAAKEYAENLVPESVARTTIVDEGG